MRKFTIKFALLLVLMILLTGCNAVLNYSSTHRMHTIAKITLKLGGNPNNTDTLGLTPFHAAAMKHDLEMLKVLESGGANINAKTNFNENILNIACDDIKIMSRYIEKGVDLNNQMTNSTGVPMLTPLMCAVASRNLDAVKLLIENGAKKDVETGASKTGTTSNALKIAERKGFIEITNLLK